MPCGLVPSSQGDLCGGGGIVVIVRSGPTPRTDTGRFPEAEFSANGRKQGFCLYSPRFLDEMEDAMSVNFPTEWRRFGISTLSIAVVLFAVFTITVQTTAQNTGGGQIITFDAPGAGVESGQGTVPRSMNSKG